MDIETGEKIDIIGKKLEPEEEQQQNKKIKKYYKTEAKM